MWLRRPAFTLLELLVCIAVVGVLLACIALGMGGAYDAAVLTRCQTNLSTIFKAQSVWRVQRQAIGLVTDAQWAGRLMPFVETQTDVFRCPAAVGTGDAAGGSDGGSNTGTATHDKGNWERAEVSFEIDVYWQEPYASKKRGKFGYSIPLGAHPWVRRTDKGQCVYYEVDDAGSTGGGGATFDDIKLNIWYDDGRPTRVDILKAPNSGSNMDRFVFDLRANGEVIVENWTSHYGESVEVKEEEVVPVAADYGLSRGTYEVTGREVARIDANLFFILDYPLSMADYNKDGQDDVWHKHFITQTPAEWEAEFSGTTTGGWQTFQALRHGGAANVLFCDGHIETLPAEELGETDLRWLYRGR